VAWIKVGNRTINLDVIVEFLECPPDVDREGQPDGEGYVRLATLSGEELGHFDDAQTEQLRRYFANNALDLSVDFGQGNAPEAGGDSEGHAHSPGGERRS
jgi:hypothetical protein